MRLKNTLLTIWILLPLALVGLLVWWIFASLSSDAAPKMRPLGQGAGDTGGANAIGEWLAGRDPDEVQRVNRAIREGTLVDPIDWPGGFTVVLVNGAVDPDDVPTLGAWDGAQYWSTSLFEQGTDGRWSATLLPEMLEDLKHPATASAGLYLLTPSRGAETIEGRLTDAAGRIIAPITLPPVVPADTARDRPIVVEFDWVEAQNIQP